MKTIFSESNNAYFNDSHVVEEGFTVDLKPANKLEKGYESYF